MSSEYKPLSDDIAYPLASWFGKPKGEKHFSWNEGKIWPYRRGNGVGIHVEYDDHPLLEPDWVKSREPSLIPALESIGESVEGLHSESGKIQDMLSGIVKRKMTCQPYYLKMKATVEGDSVEIDDTIAPFFACSPDIYLREEKQAWAIAFSLAKKASQSPDLQDYVIAPGVNPDCGSRRHPRVCPYLNVVPRRHVNRFREWMSSLVSRVAGGSEGILQEEDVEGRIASLF
ncbi:hypothetical protein [Candidatus Methanodesulfokora washburnensis]|uniref:Uncharacterized protein n=1 Tax=Candidatus Methanodesulfokora washburnensis TaxID=2478471 RepID=A0A3R9PT97_9CREN|nr:hypothetical protein [Candidatus Methanodesulfokores washburnensis]RSN72459.1 hypothetical protein D6D85_13695 [Candidatus Methanodesulfokores washburnensis]